MILDSENQESKQGTGRTPFLCSTMTGRAHGEGLESSGDFFTHVPGHLGWGDPKAGLGWDCRLEGLSTRGFLKLGGLGIVGLLERSSFQNASGVF